MKLFDGRTGVEGTGGGGSSREIGGLSVRHIQSIQLMVTIISSGLMVLVQAVGSPNIRANLLIVVFISSNILVRSLPLRYFQRKSAFYYLIFFDNLMCCTGILLCGNVGGDFYLSYFLIMGAAAMSTGFKCLMANTLLFISVYGWILFENGFLTGDLADSYVLRLPSLVLMAMFFGGIIDLLKKDQRRRLQASEKKLRATLNKLISTQNQLVQSEKMAAMGRLASGLAHQVKNPLEIVLMGVEFIDSILPQDDPSLDRAIGKIKQAVCRTDDIVADFLSFSRKSELQFAEVDLCKIIDNTVQLVGHRMKHGTIRLKRDYRRNPAKVMADTNMLQQVFVNLLNNAIDAMPSGGDINIRVYEQVATNKTPNIGQRSTDHFRIGEKITIVELEDTGKGIEQSDLFKVFEPFYTTKKAGKGTGLGLSMVHLIIERHRGIIYVVSRLNQGTKFTLKIKSAT